MKTIMLMMIGLLSGMLERVTKGSKNFNKKRLNAYCLAPIKMEGLVYDRRREKRDHGHKHETFLYLMTGYKTIWVILRA